MGIGLTVSLIDQFSSRATAIDASMGGMANSMANLKRQQAMAAITAGTTMVAAGGAVVGGYARMVKAASNYEYTLAAVKAVTADSIIGMEQLDRKAQYVAGRTVHTLDQVADAMKFMGMAGVSRKDIIATIDAVAALGEATGHQIAGKGGTADIITNIMKAYRIPAEQSARVADILAKGTLSANTNIFDLGEAIKYTAATAMDLNVGLEETTAMIMAMGNAGIQASMAGTAVENMLRYVTTAAGPRATKGDIWALGQLGMRPEDLKDTYGNLKPIAQILQTMLENSKGIGTADRQTIFQEIFGVRGKRAGSLLIRALNDYKGFVKDLQNIEPGYASRVAAERRENIEGDLLLLTSAWSKFEVAATKALYWPIRFGLWLTKTLVDLGTAIANIPILGNVLIGGVVVMGAIIGAVGTVLLLFGTMAFMLNQIGMAYGALTTVQAVNTTASVAGWTLQTAAAGRYLAALRAIALGNITANGMVRGAGGRFVGHMAGYGVMGTIALWAGKAMQGLKWLGSGIMSVARPFVAGLMGILGPLALFASAAIAVAGTFWALGKAIDWVHGLIDPQFGKPKWDLDPSKAISIHQYLKDPDAFDKNKVFIKYNAGEGLLTKGGNDEPKERDFTNLNIYFDGQKAMQERIERGSSRDIYQEIE